MKYKMSELQDLLNGTPAAVLGGGPSLLTDMAKLPPNCILIAVNEHASRICVPDFVVFKDLPEHHPELLEVLVRPGNGPTPPTPLPEGKGERWPVRVSENAAWSDVVIDCPIWSYCYSSTFAAWFGLHLGCDPVIMCGMDCYQGPTPYFHEWDQVVPAMGMRLDDHLRPWTEEGVHKLPHLERLKVMSGPLVQIFGKYESGLTASGQGQAQPLQEAR